MKRTGKVLSIACLAAGFLVASAPAVAREAESEWSFSGNIAVTNDYVFRGFTQSNEDFAVQGGVHLGHASGFYIGTWASNVEFGDTDTTVEIDFYGGFAGTFANSIFSYDIGAIYYMYPGDLSGSDYAYWEFYGDLSVDMGWVIASTGIVYSPDFFSGTGDAIHIPLRLGASLPLDSSDYRLRLSGQIGYNRYIGSSATWDGFTQHYLNWNIGMTVSITDWFDVDLRYHDTSLNGIFCKDICDARVTLAVSKAL
jgi:uncharacterized protein (TIGR02001 family)